jgi:hypothetical protein
MSWLLKQAEDMLNRVDQQTNAAINQHNVKSTSGKSNEESISDSSSLNSSNKSTLNFNSTNRGNRRQKKNDDTDLIDYLNSSTTTNNKSNRAGVSNNLLSDTARTASSPNMLADDPSETPEQSLSKSTSGTPRSITPAVQFHDDDQGLILVRNSYYELTHCFFVKKYIEYSINTRLT